MGTEIKIWQIKEDKLELLETTMAQTGRTEPQDLEKWVKHNPEILGENILIIGEQVQTKSGPLDLLGIDESGNIIIIELKREQIPREALAQAIDYASDVASWGIDKLNEVCNKYNNKSLEGLLTEKIQGIDIDSLSINQTQRILLVGTSIEESLQRMIEWLSDEYEMGINSILLKYVKTSSGDELIVRTIMIPEEEEQEKIRRKQGKRLPDFSVRIKNAVKEGKLKEGDVLLLDIEKIGLDDAERKRVDSNLKDDKLLKLELTGLDNRLHIVKWLYDNNTYSLAKVGEAILQSLELPAGKYWYSVLYAWKKEGGNEYISDLIS